MEKYKTSTIPAIFLSRGHQTLHLQTIAHQSVAHIHDVLGVLLAVYHSEGLPLPP
jgi:hypothetical protein